MYPWMYPGFYSPGQMAFTNNAEMSQLMTMAAGPLLGALAGPGNFMPHMMPTQNLMDQYALRAYQTQTRQATMNLAGIQNQNVGNIMLGMRSAVTPAAASDLNREQAMNMAGIVNNPFVKAAVGMAVGPENLEAMLYGSRGDATALGNVINRIGYYRPNPTGGGRMNAESLTGFSSALFANLYEPGGDVAGMASDARANRAGAIDRLQAAADMRNRTVVSDADVTKRLRALDAGRLDEIYNQYVQGGTATDAATQAQELTKFDRAIAASGVLKDNEATIGQLETRAKQMPTAEMHGLLGSQVGQLTENLFQRGLLPQSLGAMSAADRVKAMSAATRDPETLDRLAEEYLKQDLGRRTDAEANSYRALETDEQRRQFLRENDRLKKARTTVEGTLSEIDKTARGDRGAKSITELEEMGGFNLLATNVDASRTASTLKQYTGSVAAIREIFGDNGNPNAPMPALLAVLDQLTQGSMGSMKPAQVETTLRQMQTLAKESGVGLEQLATLSATMGARGQQLGIAPQVTMQNVAGTLAMIQTMQNTGAFSGNVFGSMDKGAAMNRVGELMQRGDASKNALSMAALARIVSADPSRFNENSEIAQAVKAYNDPSGDGSYTFTDANGRQVTRNIRELVGRGGPGAVAAMLTAGGGSSSELGTMMLDPRTKEFMQAGFGFLTQKYEAVRDLNARSTSGNVGQALRGAGLQSDRRINNVVGQRVTQMIVDSAGMNVNDQIAYMKKNMEGELVKLYTEQGLGNADAARQAAAALSDESTLNRMIAGAGAVHARLSGGENLVALAQRSGMGRDAQGAAEAARSAAVAEKRRRMNIGFEGTPLARISDYLADIGARGEKFNMGEFLRAMAPVISDQEMLQRYAEGMSGGFEALTNLTQEVTYTQKDIEDAAAKNDIATLRKHSGFTNNTIVSSAEMTRRRAAKIKGMTDAELREAYKTHTGSDVDFSTLSAADKQSRIDELKNNAGFTSAVDMSVLDHQKGEKSFDQLKAAAMSVVGKVKEGQEARYGDVEKIHRAFMAGEDKSILDAGIAASMRVYGVGTNDAKKFSAAITGGKKDELLSALGMSEAQYQAGQKSLLAGKFGQDSAEYKKHAKAGTFMALLESPTHQLSKSGLNVPLQPGAQAGVKQRIEKADIQATTVVVNADGVQKSDRPLSPEGGPPTPPPAAGLSSANVTQQTQGEYARQRAVLEQSLAPPLVGPPKPGEQAAGDAAKPATWGASTAGAVRQSQIDAAAQAAEVQPATLPQPAGGTGETTLNISGSLSLDGLDRVLLEATSDRAVATEGGGSPIVKDPPRRPSTRRTSRGTR